MSLPPPIPTELKLIAIPAKTAPPIANVIILHGWGANATDAASFAQLMELPETNLFLPEGPWQHPFSLEGRMWYSLPDPLESFDFDFGADCDLSAKPELQTSRQLLHKLLQQLVEQTGIGLDRTILGGFSQGGAMTVDVGLDLPLAGLMSLSGYLHKSLTKVTAQTQSVLMVHGQQDPVVPFTASQFAQSAIAQTGAEVEYHAFESMGHEISWDVIALMRQFIQAKLD
jgi:phospholipase/carboxylesterase